MKNLWFGWQMYMAVILLRYSAKCSHCLAEHYFSIPRQIQWKLWDINSWLWVRGTAWHNYAITQRFPYYKDLLK